jgi:hypothetical protein
MIDTQAEITSAHCHSFNIKGLSVKAPLSMTALPLVLLLLSRGILANQAPLDAQNNKCFSSTLSGKSNYDACCSGVQEGISKLNNAGNASQVFQYSCASYVQNYDGEFEQVYSARSCAEACAADASCIAGSWDSSSFICLTASATDLQFIPDSEESFLRFVKVAESDLPPTDAIECDDQVTDAKLSCEIEQEEKCKIEMKTQRQDLRSQCDQRLQDQCRQSGHDEDAAEQCKKEKSALEESLRSECDVEKDNAAKQWEENQAARNVQDLKARNELEAKIKQLQKQEAENNKKADEVKKILGKLQQENKQLQERLKKGSSEQDPANDRLEKPGPRLPSKPSDKDPVYEVPSLSKFNKCSDMEGQEYTVLGVTYRVFCAKHPDDGAEVKREWLAKDPSFLMGMCSITPGCQGVKLRENFAQLSPKHDFPPTKRVDRKYWSLVPKEQRADNDVSDIRSQVMDDENKVRCPEVDGQVITLGERSYQLNCNKKFSAHKRKTASGIKSFNECLVSCSVTKGCMGVMRGQYCSLVFSHHVLSPETPEEDQSKGDTWVAMLTEVLNS